MTLYIEKNKYATRKLLELLDEFSKITGYKINAQKSLKSLDLRNGRSETKIQETITFIISLKK